MEPLDLRLAPPRAPRAAIAGVVFLPRSIDKMRASLPGGHLGEYRVPGFTEMMLEQAHISLGDFAEAVRRATTDDDVAAFFTTHAEPGSIEAWNAFVSAREPAGGDRKLALERYPFLVDHPEMVLALDVLAEDDRRSYSE